MNANDPREKRSEELNDSELENVAGGTGQPHHLGDTGGMEDDAPIDDPHGDPNANPGNPGDPGMFPDEGSKGDSGRSR